MCVRQRGRSLARTLAAASLGLAAAAIGLTAVAIGLLATVACGVEDPSDPLIAGRSQPIINGTRCGPETEPSAVALILEGTIEFPQSGTEISLRVVICAGTLIAPDVVLTAAHCLTPELLTGGAGTIVNPVYYVAFEAELEDLADPLRGLPPQFGGKPLAELPASAIKARAVLPHPKFEIGAVATIKGVQGNFHDIGLLFLEAPATVQPAIVITKEEAAQLVVKAPVHIAGWGQQTAAPQNPMVPPPPGSVGVKICATSWINEIGTHEMQIGGEIDSSRKCHGDSGGPSYLDVETPLTHKRRVVGITSHAYDETDCAKGGVDTRVDVWLDWLDSELKKRCRAEPARAFCDVPGLIPPSHYEPVPSADGGGGATRESGRPSGRGCTCGVGGQTARGLAATTSLALALLLVAFRRRLRRNGRREGPT